MDVKELTLSLGILVVLWLKKKKKERTWVWWYTHGIRALQVGRSKARGYLQLHTEFEASLGYHILIPILKSFIHRV